MPAAFRTQRINLEPRHKVNNACYEKMDAALSLIALFCLCTGM
jgi:hypothetical protein